VTALIVSPVSWDHHWVWVAPALAVLTDLAACARGILRVAWSAAAGLVTVVFGAWPSVWKGGGSAVPWGLIWYAPYTPYDVGEIHPEYHWAGLQLLAGNLYLLAGLVMLATAAGTVAGRVRLPHCGSGACPRRPLPSPASPPAAAP